MSKEYQKRITNRTKDLRKNNRFQILIGSRVKSLRKQKGIKLVELSELSGVQIATLSRIEKNMMSGTIESHYQIAKVLDLELHELYKNVNIITKKLRKE